MAYSFLFNPWKSPNVDMAADSTQMVSLNNVEDLIFGTEDAPKYARALKVYMTQRNKMNFYGYHKYSTVIDVVEKSIRRCKAKGIKELPEDWKERLLQSPEWKELPQKEEERKEAARKRKHEEEEKWKVDYSALVEQARALEPEAKRLKQCGTFKYNDETIKFLNRVIDVVNGPSSSSSSTRYF